MKTEYLTPNAMKSKFFLSCLFAMSLGLVSAFGAKPTAAQIAQAAARQKALLESKNYSIYLNQGSSLSEVAISISAVVRINGSEIYSSLPYWGDGRTATRPTDAAMRFTGTISDYEVTEGKKNKMRVTFTASEPSGKTYKFRFEVFYNGRADLATSATNLQPMRYSGYVGPSSELDKEGK